LAHALNLIRLVKSHCSAAAGGIQRCQPTAYGKRNTVERVFAWLKENRRLATRFEKLAINFAAMWKLASTMRITRELVAT
jgi:transposase